MNTYPSVSVIIPTIGRDSLYAAVSSALVQSVAVLEVVVVADTTSELALPEDERIRVVRTGPGSGSSNARQAGIVAASGEIIALLDDDDLWHPFKLERQLDEVAAIESTHWVVSCKCAVREAGRRERIWPRRTIGARQPVAEYLFRLHGLRMGGGMLQSSTLCFPRSLALEVPLNFVPDSIHDEPGWLMALQDRLPDFVFRHVPDCFSIYNIGANSVSRRPLDMSEKYIAWGREHLHTETGRVRGDYFLTSAVAAAASARSLRSIGRSVSVGFSEGSPGLGAILYAATKFGKTAARNALGGGAAEVARVE
ncbi:glycosyltransferase family 2 protein [Rhodococcoides yunnanense]|uniref:glycosyltransferase family 2 protein n=1 Tax=Rhodococcoides yunnanense TaxID=278209 RepID=UPI0009327F66|nr:glycosyltransferase [Rhodococcus yunnanensis]